MNCDGVGRSVAPVKLELRPILARINLGLVERLLLELDLRGAPLKDEWFMRELTSGFQQVGPLPPE